MAKLVSKVYGDALLEAAREKEKLDAVFDEAKALCQVFEDHLGVIQQVNQLLVVLKHLTESLRLVKDSVQFLFLPGRLKQRSPPTAPAHK